MRCFEGYLLIPAGSSAYPVGNRRMYRLFLRQALCWMAHARPQMQRRIGGFEDTARCTCSSKICMFRVRGQKATGLRLVSHGVVSALSKKSSCKRNKVWAIPNCGGVCHRSIGGTLTVIGDGVIPLSAYAQLIFRVHNRPAPEISTYSCIQYSIDTYFSPQRHKPPYGNCSSMFVLHARTESDLRH